MSFILRRITSEGLELNTCLGIEYVLVSKERNADEFKVRTKLWNKEDLQDVEGIVCFEEGVSIMPLYKKSTYYIMMGDGQTFARIN